MIDWEKVQRDVNEAYGDGETLDYRFAALRLARRPYAALIGELLREFWIYDTTELDTDVAQTLALRNDKTDVCLRLSLIGPYASLSDKDGRFISSAQSSPRLLNILKSHEVGLIDPEDLFRQLNVAGAGDFDAYVLLFSFDDDAHYQFHNLDG